MAMLSQTANNNIPKMAVIAHNARWENTTELSQDKHKW